MCFSSYASWDSALSMCYDLGGTLPILESMEDIKLFSTKTGYMNVVYLGAKTNHNLNSHDHYVWTDQSRFNFLKNVVGMYAPQADIYHVEARLIKSITLPIMSGSGACVALVYFPLLSSWRVASLPCNVYFNVSLFCLFHTRHNLAQNTTLSTLYISATENNFTAINKGRYCSNEGDDDVHWFQQDEICLHIRKCGQLSTTEYECCELQRPYVFQPGDTQSGAINNKSVVGRFLSLFKAKWTSKGKRLGTVVIPVLHNNTRTINISADKVLNVSVQEDFDIFWALQGTVDVIKYPSKANMYDHNNVFSLCVKDSLLPVKQKCHPSYFQCHDGTCVGDQLVCDGKQHCINGEDEAKCTGICTHSTACAQYCSYKNDCRCTRGYFQCQSGGCIPVGKLCDGASNCADGSDEPATCAFASAQTHRSKLEESWTQQKRQCSHAIEDEVFLQKPFQFNSDKEITTNCSTDSDAGYDIGIKYIICNDNARSNVDMFRIECWCIYSYSWFPPTGYEHFPCANGYHLSSCENMHCIDTFKCPRSYCLNWKYVCDNMCDCPHCEDESICTNVSCPGMILHESAHGKVYCNDQADDRLAAVLIRSSSYDLYTHAQAEMCAQVLNCNETINTWNSIVYLDLLHGDHLDHPHVTVEMMEFLTYCNITYFNLVDKDTKYLQNLIAVQYLDLSHNNIQDNISFALTRLTELIYLDLSFNHLSHLGRFFLCMYSNLRYLFLQNNNLVYLHPYVFHFTMHLTTICLQSNALQSKSVDSELLNMQSSLITLSSDLPRLCCMVQETVNCSPKFTLFVSCSDMIQSKFHVYLAWITGVVSSSCNMASLTVLLAIFWLRGLSGKQPLIVLMSFNITLADMIVSVCLTFLSIYNAYYQGVFGISAVAWRQSMACYTLELFTFICTECSLVFSVYLAGASYMNITSLTGNSHSVRMYLIIIVSCMGNHHLTWNL